MAEAEEAAAVGMKKATAAVNGRSPGTDAILRELGMFLASQQERIIRAESAGASNSEASDPMCHGIGVALQRPPIGGEEPAPLDYDYGSGRHFGAGPTHGAGGDMADEILSNLAAKCTVTGRQRPYQ